ncbi:galactose-3-O-sulfotransferase 2-like isoform X2 [Tigriopus californicus]|uniref:galactose-3-O-sulfotransferase 2-like isoform X2 n=1 Tax=Tigriopus californicus TaxID=6832 RepID=UPI0027DA2CC3|nr:galactose-3-O-sulfotransferase 2-like isoform X2 [Tigriopus californicus]
MHKTGSTTISNIIYRHAMAHDLNVALPKRGTMLGYPQRFHRAFTDQRLYLVLFDILCSHMVWDLHQVERTIGKKPFTFTILRDPVERFISFWDHYQLGSHQNLHEFIRNPKGSPHPEWLTMVQEMGYGNSESKWNAEDVIRYTDANFKLILIQEHWNESMFLLWHSLHWNIKDFGHLPQLKRDEEHKSIIDHDERKRLEEWLKLDHEIYKHYLTVFQEKLNHWNPSDLQEGLDKMALVQTNVTIACEVKETLNANLSGILRKTFDSHFLGFNVKNTTDCLSLAMPEETLVRKIRKVQLKKFHVLNAK